MLLIAVLVVGGGLAWVSERWNAQALGVPHRSLSGVEANDGGWLRLRSASGFLLPNAPRWIAVLALVFDAGLLTPYFATAAGPDQAVWLDDVRLAWIPRFGIGVHLALDGVSLLLIALTLLLGVVAVAASWREITERVGLFHACVLWTLAGVLGVFLALDLFLFFVCWEVMIVPMYFLIALWGHEDRAYAAIKFFLFTQVSGLVMLLAIVVLVLLSHAKTGVYSFDYFALLGTELSPDVAPWLMLGFFAAFAVKLPAVPFHTWLPDAHTQAPTGGSVILAGVLLKTGAYGLLRFAIPLFPNAAADFAPTAMALGVASILYGGVLAFAQSDFKRLVAYSSVSHMGFVLVGLYARNPMATQGAVMTMLAHGLSAAALFMLAGALQDRLHTRDMERMGGLWTDVPRLSAMGLFFAVAGLGLPGLGNFVGEFLVLAGAFRVSPLMASLAALGLIVAPVYSLMLVQRAFHGERTEPRDLTDFGARELAAMACLIVATVAMGLYPQPLLDITRAGTSGLTGPVVAGGRP
ncbi:MAG: NADH-quinone oxidoreductase subunit M [Methylomagnum sp.]